MVGQTNKFAYCQAWKDSITVNYYGKSVHVHAHTCRDKYKHTWKHVNPEINTHSSTPQERNSLHSMNYTAVLSMDFLTVVWRIVVLPWIKVGRVNQKTLTLLGAVWGVLAMPVILNSVSDICIVDIHSPNYRTVPVSVLLAVTEFSITELFHCLTFIRKRQLFMRVIVYTSRVRPQ